MKIALVYLGRRGSGGPFSLELGRALAHRADLSAVVSEGLESLSAWSGAPFPVQVSPTFESALGAAWSLLFPDRIRALAAQIRARQPDVLLFPMAHPWNAALQKALSPTPSVIFVHDPIPHPGLAGWLHTRIEKPSLRRAAHCILLSQSLAPELARRGVPLEQITVVPHGLLAYPQPPAGASPAPTLLFFGRITPYKGLEVLLAAFERLSARRPELRLRIAGEGSLAPYRRQMACLKNLEIINCWLDEEKIPAIFNGVSLLALPYTSASQSGVLAIAAGYGLPVVATRAGGLAEQIRSGETGLLVSPGSVDELADAVETLLADPDLAGRLGTALRRDFELHRSWEGIAETILQTCAKLR
jgi:glycosyltransferase involved in cell wall biosynthesis